jgi:hypothetical protein
MKTLHGLKHCESYPFIIASSEDRLWGEIACKSYFRKIHMVPPKGKFVLLFYKLAAF